VPENVSYLSICLLIIFLITPAASKEVAYVYGEGGGHSLENINLTEHTDTYAIKYIVAGIGSGTSSSHETNTTVATIKSEIKQKINKGNDPVRTEGRKLVGNISGLRRIDQICSIYDSLVDVKNWTYVGDWTGLEELQYSNKSLELGKPNRLGMGDCDDFSILLAALLESVQATPRIIFAYGPAGGHAYAQVYLGKEGDESDRMIDWMKTKYKVSEINYIKNETTEDVWLNLDWWKDPKSGAAKTKHPGGPFFSASEYIPVYPEGNELENPNPLTPVPVPPISKFSISNANPNAKENVTFDASKSSDADTKIKLWNWDFGDGERGRGELVIHAYSQGGRYNVALTVTDDDEVEKSSQLNQTIEVNGLPVPIISYNPKEPKLGDFIDFDASQSIDSEPEGSIKNYYWDFDDGEKSSRKHHPYVYETNGSYNVSLTVEDDRGAKNTTSIKIKVNLPPIPSFAYTPKEPNAGDPITFNASSSSDPDGTIINYEWNFEDNRTTKGELATYRFSKGGNQTVRLTVRDDNNATENYSEVVKVNELPVPAISYDIPEPKVEDTIVFDTSGSIDSDGSITSYEWSFGDGTHGEGLRMPHKYLLCDSYIVKLMVIDNKGSRNSTTVVLPIRGNPKEIFALKNGQCVPSLAFSPDGKTMATASFGSIARLWDVSNGDEIHELSHHGQVISAAFSPDSRTVATASIEDNLSRLWDVSTGQELHKLLHDGPVYSVAFSPDGKTVATASYDNTSRLWDVSTGRELHKLPHDGPVYSVAFSPDGKTLATASYDNTSRLWDVSTGQELHKLPHDGQVRSVAFSPDGKTVATGCWDNTACLWDVSTGQELHKLPHNNTVESVAFSPDGKTVATASYDNTACLWDVSSGQELHKLDHDDGAFDVDYAVSSVAFRPDGRTVATACRDNTARLWDTSSGKELHRLYHEGPVKFVAFSPDGMKLATASCDDTARLWELGKCI
jgi:WD40 repeat protein